MGDVDGDGDIEIIVATAGGNSDLSIFAWHHDGTGVDGWPFIERRSEVGITSGPMSSPALTDLDMDGNLDVVVAGQNGKVYAIKTNSIYDPSTMEWPMFRHDPQHTGLYAEVKPKSPLEHIAVLNQMLNGRQRLFIFNPPDTVKGETGPPIASDVTFGNANKNKKIVAIAGIRISVSEGPTCTENSDCGSGEYCAKLPGNCEGLGDCTPIPEICNPIGDPVCGCDGSTYPNACTAASWGVNVAYDGECLQ